MTNFKNLIPSRGENVAENNLQELSQNIVLSYDTKERVRSRLFRDMAKVSHGPHHSLVMFLHLPRPVIAILLICIVSVTSYAGVVKADESKPGDPLFALDKLIENIQLSFSVNSEASVKLKLSIAAERIQELAELTETFSDRTPVNGSKIDLQGINFDPSLATTTATTTTSIENNYKKDDSKPASKALSRSIFEVKSILKELQDELTETNKRSASATQSLTGQITALMSREKTLLRSIPAHDNDPVTDKKIIICHIPDGNEKNVQTIETTVSSWPAHVAHGDTLGACSDQEHDHGQSDANRSHSDENDTTATSTDPSTAQSTDHQEQTVSSDPKSTSDNEKRNEHASTFPNIFESTKNIFSDIFNTDGERTGEKVKIDGVIEHSNGNLIINGSKIEFDDDTDVSSRRQRNEQEDRLDVGRWADIEGEIQKDGTIRARRIKLK